MRIGCYVAVSVLLVGACGGSGGGETCPVGTEAVGRACVPIFDDCPGAAEIPILGGGCRAVGVRSCAAGFRSDDAGGCEPVLPGNACAPGTRAVLGETTCQPVGVTACAAGFGSDNAGGCEPVLPDPTTLPCPAGSIAVLGQSTCQPLGDCGTGVWGNIVTDASTVFVDQGYAGGGSDGSQAAPFLTLTDALAAVAPGGQVAVAAGTYTERVQIGRALRLEGRCAERVTIQAITLGGPVVEVLPLGSGSTIRGLTVTGAGAGIHIDGATNIVVDQVEVAQCGQYGVRISSDSDVLLSRVKVWEAVRAGVLVLNSRAEITESVVVDAQADVDGFGWGIEAACGVPPAGCSTVDISASVVLRNTAVGVAGAGSDITIHGSAVMDTGADAAGNGGRGVSLDCTGRPGECGGLTMTGSYLSGNREVAVFSLGVDLDIIDTVVTGTLPRQSNGSRGAGVATECHTGSGDCGTITLTSSVLTENRWAALSILGGSGQVTGSLIADTMADNTGVFGRGVSAECGLAGDCGTFDVTDSLVRGNRNVGLFAWGVELQVAGSDVRDQLPDVVTGEFGRGIVSQCAPSWNACPPAAVDSSLVLANRHSGILAGGVDLSLTSSYVADTALSSEGLFGRGVDGACLGGVCGTVTVTDSVVVGNHEAGIAALGPHLDVAGTTVKDHRENQLGFYGRGIAAECDRDLGVCPTVSVEQTLVANNLEIGIWLWAVTANVMGSLITDTGLNTLARFGRGIDSECNSQLLACGSLVVSETLVRFSLDAGIVTAGDGTVQGAVVRDTAPTPFGPNLGLGGFGVYSACFGPPFGCGLTQILASAIEGSEGAGVVFNSDGLIDSSRVSDTVPRQIDQAFGFGLQVDGATQPVVVHARHSEIAESGIAGVLFVNAGGSLSRCRLHGSSFSVVIAAGSNPMLGNDNELSGQLSDEPTVIELTPAPAPDPALPSGLDQSL